MSSFILKIIAVVTMFTDHVGYVIFGKFSYFNYIGRLAFPIFAFQISEGYLHTKNIKKYYIRLIIFALISQVPYMLFLSYFTSNLTLNVFFTLLFGLTAILIYDKLNNKFLGIILAICLAIVSQVIKCEYGFFGVSIIFLFYIFKNNRIFMNISYILAVFIYYLPRLIKTNFYYPNLILYTCTTSSILLINLYNGKKGKDTKYLLYLFYPLHLSILFVVHYFFNK